MWVLCTSACFCLGLYHPVAAQIPRLASVPDSLPRSAHRELTRRRNGLLAQRGALQASAQSLEMRCGSVVAGTPLATACAREQAVVLDARGAYTTSTTEFNRQVCDATSREIEVLTKQVDQTKRQLGTLGFAERVNDFERFSQMSTTEQVRLKLRLIEQLKAFALAKGDGALRARFLESTRALSADQAKAVAVTLQGIGADDSGIQDWFRAFSPNASREVLADGVREAIKFLETEAKPFEGGDQLEVTMVDARQQAVLALLSLVEEEYPALQVLKALSAGLYAAGEANVYLYLLEGQVEQLDRVTTHQLDAQRILVGRMESTIRKRSSLRADLQMLPDP